ncbi:hypothetical protein M5D96_011095 [Drosophila gunungcola]|uniref:Uncharacterized protein n=1 Tax=Drosophila gunungcola TaxID=103775 RepID=A0A9P9YFQ5_9MUSC|nr:hypothetical protein M5D96_011095 [Drosophila gunungcola]
MYLVCQIHLLKVVAFELSYPMKTISKTDKRTGGLMALVIVEIIETLAIGGEIVKITEKQIK